MTKIRFQILAMLGLSSLPLSLSACKSDKAQASRPPIAKARGNSTAATATVVQDTAKKPLEFKEFFAKFQADAKFQKQSIPASITFTYLDDNGSSNGPQEVKKSLSRNKLTFPIIPANVKPYDSLHPSGGRVWEIDKKKTTRTRVVVNVFTPETEDFAVYVFVLKDRWMLEAYEDLSI